MKRISLSSATPPQLDWLVAYCEGLNPSATHIFNATWPDGLELGFYQPSTSHAQGGPITEREGINTCIQHDEPGYKFSPERRWYAQLDHRVHTAYGPTPLIAAMRCYVASKLGDTVAVPEELS